MIAARVIAARVIAARVIAARVIAAQVIRAQVIRALAIRDGSRPARRSRDRPEAARLRSAGPERLARGERS